MLFNPTLMLHPFIVFLLGRVFDERAELACFAIMLQFKRPHHVAYHEQFKDLIFFRVR